MLEVSPITAEPKPKNYLWSPLQSQSSMSMFVVLPLTVRLESSNSTILTPCVGRGVSASSMFIESEMKLAMCVLPL